MPELAEVETVRRGLLALIGEKIINVKTDTNPRFMGAQNSLGLTLNGIRRRGKYLIFDLGPKEMVIHLGMTGALLLDEEGLKLKKFRVRWELESGSVLTLGDVRGFGRADVVAPGVYTDFPGLMTLGPEPLEAFDRDSVAAGFMREGTSIKARLLSQKYLAGVGNYVADEALWAAKINPDRRALNKTESLRLIDSVVSVLRLGIEMGGMSIRDYKKADGTRGSMSDALNCYNRSGLPCPRCQTTLIKTVVAGRGSTWCPNCQK